MFRRTEIGCHSLGQRERREDCNIGDIIKSSTPQASEDLTVTIVCPLCRFSSSVLRTEAEGVRRSLRVDEDVLRYILNAGVLQNSSAEDSESEDEDSEAGEKSCFENAYQAVDGNAAPRSRKGKLWRSVKRFCGRLVGNSSQNFQRDRSQCMTEEDMRDLALMSCYMM
ncbi:hypothetical protein AGOR_G00076130 [Albula goreensis]|uniref:Uncharacterized protein n=1 Tax=Albula goreensis TaxID=1534307 RepID=A0A8T3DSM6_9TELE|nr:hypothetical protein AGOR_G00076130 [Albula goreensis]